MPALSVALTEIVYWPPSESWLPLESLPSQVKLLGPELPVPVPVHTVLPEESLTLIETFEAAEDSE